MYIGEWREGSGKGGGVGGEERWTKRNKRGKKEKREGDSGEGKGKH